MDSTDEHARYSAGARQRDRDYWSACGRAALALLRPRTSAREGERAQLARVEPIRMRGGVALKLSIAAMVAITLVVASVGIRFRIAGLVVSATTLSRPLAILFALVVVHWTLADSSSGRWRLPRLLDGIAGAHPLERALFLLSAFAVASSWTAVPRIVGLVRESLAPGEASGSSIPPDPLHAHLAPLVDWVRRQAASERLVIVIEDRNPRGHLASYHCYPRVLLMTPQEQRWSGDLRKSAGRSLDPGFAPMPERPPREASAELARRRGATFLIARPTGVEPIATPAADAAKEGTDQ